MNMIYRAAVDPTTKNLALFAREDKALPFGENGYPVVFFSPGYDDHDSTINIQQLADNIADALSHRCLSHVLSSGDKDIFYSRGELGINMRVQSEGVSQPFLFIAANGAMGDMGKNVLARMDVDFMKNICDKIIPDNRFVPTPPPTTNGPGISL